MHHPPGCRRIGDRSYFTLYAPYAQKMRLAIFAHCDDKKPEGIFPMRSLGNGFWEYSDFRAFSGKYYAFLMNDSTRYIADPYARSVACFNDHLQEAKAYIFEEDFDWGNDDFIRIEDPRDLVIYECHVRDLTAGDPQVPHPGSYAAAKERIPYFKELGVNAVEFLPLMHFANFEPPYQEETEKVYNDWNPYAYNHWGYMTSFFFAPANFYSRHGNREKHRWSDPRGKELQELRSLIKALHEAGIAVIMDVVYNHISQYNRNPLRALAEDHYLRPGENHSGCGNDVNSESPVMHDLIVDSVRYWTEACHIDGFRLDLAGILDDGTLHDIREAALEVNPHAVIVGEAWGKRYFPGRMSELKLGAWNDTFRYGIKGHEPGDKTGYIFGNLKKGFRSDDVMRLLAGSVREDGGIVTDPRYSVNYLASHDGYTLGDFIRLSLRSKEKAVRSGHKDHIRLTEKEERLHRLAAFVLCCSQGVMMLHAGQEYARSKVIAEVSSIPDPQAGQLDRDSYNKDNGTNYMDFGDKEINAALFGYYRQLIVLRRAFPELRRAEQDKISRIRGEGAEFGLAYRAESASRHTAVLINSSSTQNAVFELGEGDWQVHADLDSGSLTPLYTQKESKVTLGPCSALLLAKDV